jgi:hypothetical protein
VATILVVEDGSGVVDANSYTDLADARAYLALRGLALSVTDGTAETQLIRAMDYIEALRNEFQGVKTDSAQALQWPREGATLDGAAIAPDAIPAVLWQAQARLAAYLADGVSLMPAGDGRAVTSESIAGAISVTYATGQSSNPQPALTEARALLDTLLDQGEAGGLAVERV